MKLTFWGGAGAVTGSNYLVETESVKILIDCGLNQGGHFAEKENFKPFTYNPKDIQAVFVTHAHVDHTGRLPQLPRNGFQGKIYSTPPTRDFAELLLLDSEHLMELEAQREKEEPLYSTEDVENLMKSWEGIAYHEKINVGDLSIELFNAGHILGSASILISDGEKSIIFSGDLGNSPAPIIQPTEPMPKVDYCVIESAYGDRLHERTQNRRDDLEDVVEDTVKNKGTLLIPAFAMERTQELLYHLHQLFEEKRIPKVPVYLDSPLAIKVTTVYKKYEKYFNPASYELAKTGDDILNFPELTLTLTTEQSKSINEVQSPKIVIAGSGMSQGGRILHHESRYLKDPKSTILFVGYQTAGSLGRRILGGEKQVKIFGEEIEVKAKVRSLSSYSAHADQAQLMAWVYPQRERIKKIFVVQGDEEASKILSQKFRDEFALDSFVPDKGDSVVL